MNSNNKAAWAAPVESGHKSWFLSVAAGVVMCVPVLGLGGWHVYAASRESARTAVAAREDAARAGGAYERLITETARPMLSAAAAGAGRDLYASACAMCHAPDGDGVKGLGKNLIESDFVASLEDDQLRHFLEVGRPNATPMPMPPKGGRADLTGDDLGHLVAFMRGLQDPRRMPELAAPFVKANQVASTLPSKAETDAALAAAGGNAELAEYIASGSRLYASACVACHGPAGAGVSGNGKALARSAFIKSLDDDALLAFIMLGRTPTDPKSTTGIQMPPKGGNPALSEDDILDIIAYLRTLQDARNTSAAAVK